MHEKLTVFQIAGRMAAHAGRRQTVLAQNVANADTPGYRAMDLPDFASSLRGSNLGSEMKATRATHLTGHFGRRDLQSPFERPGPADPNGNSVALDQELMYAVQAKRAHDRALAVYRSSLNLLRSSIQVR